MSDEKVNENEQVQSMLEQIKPTVYEAGRVSINSAGLFGCVLRAALVKSFEFSEFANQEYSQEQGFFVTATLRGICEDLIVLSFISRLDEKDQNRAAELLMAKNVSEGTRAQKEFFESARPWQPVLKEWDPGCDLNIELNQLAQKLGWNGKRDWPSVWFMAKATNLKPLYSYIYAATSKWVHFSPQILLRMGWGGKRGELSNDTVWEHTTKNFARYYQEFNRVYSLLLLTKLLRGPAEFLFSAAEGETVKALEDFLEKHLRWPEDITFEEMNVKSPSSFMRVLLRVAHETSEEVPNSDSNDDVECDKS